MEEQDEIVKEIPVYITKQLAKHIYLFQHPIRTRPFMSDSGPVAARIKPNSHQIELDLPFHVQSNNYDKNKGRELGFAFTEGQFRTVFDQQLSLDSEMPSFNSMSNTEEEKMIEIQTLRSTFIPAKSNYMVAVVKDDELHMTPLTGTVQLTPALHYLDKIDDKRKAANKRVSDEEKKSRGEQTDKPVQMALGRVESVESEKAKRGTITYMRKTAEEEPWTNLEYYHEHTDEANIIFENLFTSYKTDLRFLTTVESYLEDISPPVTSELNINPNEIRPGVLPRADLKKFDIKTQVKALLMNAHVLPFKKIIEFVNPQPDVKDLISCLEELAVVVHGNWVVRSGLLYKNREKLGRDHLIHMLQKSKENPPRVRRSEFDEVAKLSLEVTKQMLEELAVFETDTKAWKLKVNDDKVFIAEYPDIVSKLENQFAKEFERTQQEINAVVKPTSSGPKRRKAAPIVNRPAPVMKRPTKITIQDKVQQAIVSLLEQSPCMKRDDLVSTVKTRVPEAIIDQIEAKMAAEVIELHGRCILRFRPPYDEFRNIVIELFRTSATLKKNQILKTIMKSGKNISVKAFNTILTELSDDAQGPYTLRGLK